MQKTQIPGIMKNAKKNANKRKKKNASGQNTQGFKPKKHKSHKY